MHRSFAWGLIAILAIVLAPFAGVLGMPVSMTRADTATSTTVTNPDDEIIVITSTGQLRVDDPTPQPGYAPLSWSSSSVAGWESNWTVVAAGDFNGDGDAELVAARSTGVSPNAGSYVKVFDPVVQPGRSPVDFSVNLALDAPVGVMRNVKLIVTGNFDSDKNDEFAFVNYLPGGGTYQAAVQVYDGGTNATFGEWARKTYEATYALMFEDMGVGDFNNDTVDDLVLVRNASSQRLMLVQNVTPWGTLAQDGSFATDWYAVAGGNISTSAETPGDEITALRDSVNAQTNNLLMFRVVSGKLKSWPDPTPDWKYNPAFVSISNGDLNGDGDDEVVLLRNPTAAGPASLFTVNPFGSTMPQFSQATGYGADSFRIVRTGDTDGDGKAEIVILKADRYRLYTEPDTSAASTETPGSYYAPTNTTTGIVSNLPYLALADVDYVISGPTLGVNPASLSFSLDCGQTSPIKQLTISNAGTGSSIAWQAQAIEDSGSGWLLLNGSQGVVQGTTTGTVNVSVAYTSQGNYSGKVRITTTDPAVVNKTVDVPITYASLCSGFVASPPILDFNVAWGTTAAKTVTISAAGPTAWTSAITPVPPTSSCNGLTLSAPSGTTPSTVTVTADPRVAGVGSKQCLIIFSAIPSGTPGSPQTVTVNLTVPDPGFVVSPTSLTIMQGRTAPPVVRYITVERPKQATAWTATAQPLSATADLAEMLASGQADLTADGLVIDGVLQPAAPLDWLVFSPTAGTTNPGSLTEIAVSVKPGTPNGTYRAVITVVASGDPTLDNPIQNVTVTAIVTENVHTNLLPLILSQN
jgi:hypothetical protein